MKCIDDEIPFEIPKSWEWSRLGDICSYLHRGKSPKYGEHKFLPIIAQKCNQWDKIYTDRCLFSSKDYIEKYKEEQLVQKGDIIINSTGGGTVGRTGYIDSYVFANFDRFVVDSHVTLVRSIYPIASKYVYYFLISPLIQIGLEDRCSGSTNQIELGTTTITSYLVPIPPIKEQYRIIDQFQKVLPLLERYSTNQIAQDKLNAEINIQLKKSILQEAIQGKLVPQIAEEGTAQELLEQIKLEKQKLIKDGKLKKSALTDSVIYKGDDNKYFEKIGKTEQDITDEIPFDIPNTWVWVRHNDLFDISGGSQPPKSKFIEREKEGYIRLFQIRDYGSNPQPIYIPLSTASKISQKGDILLARYGASLGKVFYAEYGAYNVALAKVIPLYESRLIFQKYIFLYYCSSIYQNEIVNRSRCAQAGFNKEDLNSLLFPLPPLSEQYRIVEKYEKAIASIMRG